MTRKIFYICALIISVSTLWIMVNDLGGNKPQMVAVPAQANTTLAEPVIPIKTNQQNKEGEYNAGRYVFTDLQLSKTYDEKHWNVSADVQNVGDTKSDHVGFTAVFYNGDGKKIGTAFFAVTSFGVKEIKSVESLTTSDLSGWKSVRFQIDYDD